ncbi:MAG: UDP-N-acetylmuramate--L-alanine ligase [Patescibacteria group bacterium]
MDLKKLKSAHLIGVGGINMSAVAKLLLSAGVHVSGSDLSANDQTEILAARGASIYIGEAPENIPQDCELVITTSAAPVANKERIAAAERRIPEMTNFAFLGKWFAEAKTFVVAGTHGKSTTTAMLGLILERAGLDPTVIVGSKVPTFTDGNLRLGKSDLFVIEGDEYAKHFLEFKADGVILNNLELDHTDVFTNIENLLLSFHELVGQVKDGGIVVVNISDARLAGLIETEWEALNGRGIKIVTFGLATGATLASEESGDAWSVSSRQTAELHAVRLNRNETQHDFNLHVIGEFNAMNAAAAALLAEAVGASWQDITAALESFKGIWRRFEFLEDRQGALIYSDYGHHPTAVSATLKAARTAFPDKRIVLCFQPHHRNRTKILFLDFVPSFDLADVLVLGEIYEVSGRDDEPDKDISSRDLLDALARHDASREAKRVLEFGGAIAAAVKRTLELSVAGDLVIFMGAGDIDAELHKALAEGRREE